MRQSKVKTGLRAFLTVDPDPEESLRFTDAVVQRVFRVTEDDEDEPRRQDRPPEPN